MACKNCKKAIVIQMTKKSPFPAEMKFSDVVKVGVERGGGKMFLAFSIYIFSRQQWGRRKRMESLMRERSTRPIN
jgi:hypothetical protein